MFSLKTFSPKSSSRQDVSNELQSGSSRRSESVRDYNSERQEPRQPQTEGRYESRYLGEEGGTESWPSQSYSRAMESSGHQRFQIDIPKKMRKYQKVKQKKQYYKQTVQELTESLEEYRAQIQEMKMREFDNKLDMMDRIHKYDSTLSKHAEKLEQRPNRLHPDSPFGYY